MSTIISKAENQKPKIKDIRHKKDLLSNFIKGINGKLEKGDVNIPKNNLILKSLLTNLKYIDENNIIIENNKIKKIEGLNITEDGLIIPSDEIYKNKKKTKIKL